MIFETVKEAEDNAKEEIVFSIKDKVNNLKQDISDLQKHGYELKLDGIKLLGIPLKVKVWLSNQKKQELENMFSIINAVKVLVGGLKKDFEQKEAIKEARELKKEAEEKKVQASEEENISSQSSVSSSVVKKVSSQAVVKK